MSKAGWQATREEYDTLNHKREKTSTRGGEGKPLLATAFVQRAYSPSAILTGYPSWEQNVSIHEKKNKLLFGEN